MQSWWCILSPKIMALEVEMYFIEGRYKKNLRNLNPLAYLLNVQLLALFQNPIGQGMVQ